VAVLGPFFPDLVLLGLLLDFSLESKYFGFTAYCKTMSSPDFQKKALAVAKLMVGGQTLLLHRISIYFSGATFLGGSVLLVPLLSFGGLKLSVVLFKESPDPFFVLGILVGSSSSNLVTTQFETFLILSSFCALSRLLP